MLTSLRCVISVNLVFLWHATGPRTARGADLVVRMDAAAGIAIETLLRPHEHDPALETMSVPHVSACT
jgi:hypothetical protein